MVPQETDLNQLEEDDNLEPHMRDATKESQILLWIYRVLDEVSPYDYEVVIRDGIILCRLLNKLRPGLVDETELSNESMEAKRRCVRMLIRALRIYGIPEQLLFCPEDLLFLLHMPKVTRCIFTLGKMAAEDPTYKGPQLGQEPYEPVAKCGRRKGSLPLGDEIYVAHISVGRITRDLMGHNKPRRLQRRISLYNF